jgi:hypothetical protein
MAIININQVFLTPIIFSVSVHQQDSRYIFVLIYERGFSSNYVTLMVRHVNTLLTNSIPVRHIKGVNYERANYFIPEITKKKNTLF